MWIRSRSSRRSRKRIRRVWTRTQRRRRSCDAKLNADGANAALENIIRIQKDRLSDQKELQALWAKVDKLLK